MNPRSSSTGFDLFTPVQQVLQLLLMSIFKLLGTLTKASLRKILKMGPPVVPLTKLQLRCKKKTSNSSALGIDTASKRDVPLAEIDFRRHTFIVGSSGTGKTNLLTILQENALLRQRPVIFIDPKGDLETLESFRALCLQHGRPCYIFSEYHEDSISLNPLAEGSVNQIVSRIMNCFQWNEEYYRSQSEAALFKACNKLKLEGEEISLSKVLAELKRISSDEIAGLIAHLSRIQESDFASRLNSSEDKLTFSKIRQERACLYIGLSVQGYGDSARTVGKLFLGELLFNSYMTMRMGDEQGGLNNPISVHFDELGSLLVPDFIDLLNKCRSAGIELTMAVQSPADLIKVDPTLCTQIVENCGNLFVLKQRVDESAAFFSKTIGTELALKKTHATEDGEQQSRGSVREVYELLAHPDLIKNLSIGQCILLQQTPTRLRLVNIRERMKIRKIEKSKLPHKNEIF